MDILKNSREKIDQIDKQMAQLFEKRMKVVEDIILYKTQNNLPVLDNNRENLIVQKNIQYIQDKKYLDSYINFITGLMDISKKYQRNFLNQNVIGYQGTKGAFSYIALKNIFKDNKNRAYDTFEDVFKAVIDGDIEYGVIPFENSYTGEVGEVFDLLLKYDCYINRIYDLKINQNLVANKGAGLKDIKQVYSHHQAISQCKMFLKNFEFEIIPYPNTALAAEYVSQSGDISKAANSIRADSTALWS
jgi:chorismate mutase/prephenate dehydratase